MYFFTPSLNLTVKSVSFEKVSKKWPGCLRVENAPKLGSFPIAQPYNAWLGFFGGGGLEKGYDMSGGIGLTYTQSLTPTQAEPLFQKPKKNNAS